jgi:coenzyme F420 hydrogenase subunit delta
MAEDRLYFDKSTLIFGCGNVLFGDDAFGPEVVDYFNEHYLLPDDTEALRVETSIRKYLFNIALSEQKPKLILIIDAVDKERQPGELFEIDLDEIPEKKLDDFSMHQMPSSNLLKEMKEDAGMNIRILVCQVEYIPPEVQPGLKQVMIDSIPKMCEMIVGVLKEHGVRATPK